MTPVDILILGAGLSGLMAASEIVAQSQVPPSILVIDKGARVGGRLATRPVELGRADYGAQFMTVREPLFQQHVDIWLQEGLVYLWSNGWGPDFDGYPRYAVRQGFHSLAQHLADTIPRHTVDIRLNVQLQRLGIAGDLWDAIDCSGEVYQARTVVLAAPVPQSLALLDAAGISLQKEDKNALQRLHYAPCLCGLFLVEGTVNFEEPGVALNPDQVVSWMADNQRKGISPAAKIITVHANPSYSQENYDRDSGNILTELRNSLEPFLATGAVIREEHLKRWRYAQPQELYPERFLCARGLPPLYFGGDIFGGPRVEGAALSGIAIGQAISQAML